MKATNAIWLVARREIIERGREKALWISTGVTLVFITAIVFLPSLLGFTDAEEYTLGLMGEDSAAFAALGQAGAEQPVRVSTEPLSDRQAAEAALRAGDVDAVVVDGSELLTENGAPDDLAAVVQQFSARVRSQTALAEAGVPAEDAREILAPAPLPVQTLDGSPDSQGATAGIAFFAMMILYGQIFGYGMWVASGVVEEKATRVVEVLLSTIRPAHLLAGKIIGVGLLGLSQLLLIIGVSLAVVLVTGLVTLPPSIWPTVAQVFLWFLLGYAFYACAFAIVAALVPRQEDLQSAIGPVLVLVMCGFFLAIITLNSPESVIARIGTFLPFSAPMVAPIRVALGEVTALEIAGAVAVTAAASALMVVLAARVYRGAVLRTGSKVKLSDAWRSARRLHPARQT